MLPGFEAVEGMESQDQHAEAMRGLFEARLDVPWLADYWTLREEGWDWRKAAYIAWAATPVDGRWPATQEGLAHEVLGLTNSRTIRNWRQGNPAIDERVASLLVESLMDARADVIAALKMVASFPQASAHRDRKLFLEMTQLYTPEMRLQMSRAGGDVRELSDEQLVALASTPEGEGRTLGGRTPCAPTDQGGDRDDRGGAGDDRGGAGDDRGGAGDDRGGDRDGE